MDHAMASKNEPPPRSGDDPVNTVERLLYIVDEMQKHACPKMENPPSLGARKIPVSLPPLGNTSEEDLFHKLKLHLGQIKPRLMYLQELFEDIQDEASIYYGPLNKILSKVEQEESSRFRITKAMKQDLEDINRGIVYLGDKLSVLPDNPTIKKAFSSHESRLYNNGRRRCSHLPGLYANVKDFTKLQAFKQVKQEFMEFDYKRKMCLLSLGVFPENREVHRTMLMYWWIGEGILPVKGAEEAVREVLKDFTEKKLVEPVEEKRKLAPSSYKMSPFVHSSVIHLSQEIGLFDIYRKGKKPTMNNSEMGKVCLVEGSSKQDEAVRSVMPPWEIESVFNVNERYPEFPFRWFSVSNKKLTNINKEFFKSLHVLYLGRWERTQARYIQVRNPELMKFGKLMKNLRILSLQGISTVRNLDSSVCKLHNLIVLDLRECYDLTRLPEKIDSLQSLVYLDMTGCYTLEWIPMRLALLNNLEVLKGFIVSDTIYEGVACKLSYLKRLKKLRKLSIDIHQDDLSVHQLMEDLVKLETVTNLRVTWRRDFNIERAGKPEDPTKIKPLPQRLKKLDLQHFPHKQLPPCLQPQNLFHLKKLHIREGRTLEDFGALPLNATQSAVEILRLTSLPKLRVRWTELKQIYFPNMSFLEKYDCPRVSLTPCDGNGIWRSEQDD